MTNRDKSLPVDLEERVHARDLRVDERLALLRTLGKPEGAEELRQRPGERNAIIVISDGIDNRIYGTGSASGVSFKKLRNATSAMSVLVYPIFLDPFTAIPPPGWAKKAKSNMQELADATGGRLFVAQSIRDLDPVYPLVAEELRSVYTIAYYPENQKFDGSWREVQVKANRPESVVRTRSGYFGK